MQNCGRGENCDHFLCTKCNSSFRSSREGSYFCPVRQKYAKAHCLQTSASALSESLSPPSLKTTKRVSLLLLSGLFELHNLFLFKSLSPPASSVFAAGKFCTGEKVSLCLWVAAPLPNYIRQATFVARKPSAFCGAAFAELPMRAVISFLINLSRNS